MARAIGCSDASSSAPASRSTSSASSPSAATTSTQGHLPGGDRAGLVEHDGVDPRGWTRAPPGPLIRMPSWAPRPVPTIRAVGVASPRAQGQAMISTATAAVNAAASPPPVPIQNPSVADRQGDHDRHEDPGDPVGQPLHLGLAVLGVLDQPRHLGELGVRADPGGADDEPAAGVDGRADDGVAGADLDRHRLAGEHRGVDGGARPPRRRRRWRSSRRGARRTGRRPPAARSGSGVSTPSAQHRDVLGAQLEQRPQGGAGPPLGPGLEVAAGQDERRHAGGGLEVDVARAVGALDGQLERVGHPGRARVPKNSA